MKKQFLAKLLVLALVLTLVPVAAFAIDNEQTNVYYNDSTNDTKVPGTITPAAPEEETPEESTVEVKTTTNADGSTVATVAVSSTVEGTVATATVDATAMNAIVAAAKDSDIVVLSIETPRNATEATASIAASALANLARQSKADLTVESSIATITIANADLAALASGATTVDITAKAVGDTIEIVVAKDGKAVEIENGFAVEIPATAGAVIYIVNEDGTETALEDVEIANGVALVTLTGNATIRIG